MSYKTDGTYPSNSLKDRKRDIQKEQSGLKLLKESYMYPKKEWKAESQNHH